MKDVFILGAGFSKGVNQCMPTLDELSKKVKQRLKGDDRFPPPLLELGDNVELWLTYLSQSQPWLKESYNLNNRALFLDITETIGKVLDEATREAISEEEPDWLKDLIKYWDTNQSNIITLNYDTIIERAALNEDIYPEHIYPTALVDVRRLPNIIGSGPRDSFKLFKLHGSTNWYYSGATNYYGEVIYYGVVNKWGGKHYLEYPATDIEMDCRSAAADKVSLIIPPTTEKSSYLNHESMRLLWLKASAVLSSSQHIYCVGYSLPQTDLGIRFFLQHGRAPDKSKLFVVNINNEVVEHYQNLLGNSYSIDGEYGSSGIQGLMNDLKHH